MSPSKVRIGLIGLGDMGRGHLECLKSFPNIEIVALCDTHPERLANAQKSVASSPKTYSTYQEFLNHPSLEAVFVSVPNYLHCDIGLAALKAGKHLFLEKPLTHTSSDGKKLVEASQKTDLIFQVGHIYRYSPFYLEMMEWLQKDAVGTPLLLWCHEFRQPFPQREWFYDQTKSGGTFVEKNCHHFDLFNWVTQDKPKQVVAFGGQSVLKPGTQIACSYCPDSPQILKTNTTVDHGWVLVEYQKSAKANLGLSMFLRPPNEIWRGLELGVIGSNGKMLISNVDFGIMTLYGGTKKEEKKEIKNPTSQWHSGMHEEHEAFLNSIQTGQKPYASPQMAYEALILSCAAQDSLQKQKIITL